MTTMDDELQTWQREQLQAWAQVEVEGDFADRVLERMHGDEIRAQAERVVATRRRQRESVGFWIGLVAAAAAIVLALGLSQRAEQLAAPADPAELAALRADAEVLVEERCAPCHFGDAHGAQPAALAVFDASRPRWEQDLSDAQLALAVTRMGERSSGVEAARFRSFVAAELVRR